MITILFFSKYTPCGAEAGAADRPTEMRAGSSRSATPAAPLSLSSSPDRSGMVAPGGKTRRASPTGSVVGSGSLRSSRSEAENEVDGMNRRRGGGRSDPRRPPVGGRHPAGFLVYRPRPVGLGVGGAEARRGGLAPSEIYFKSYFKHSIYFLSSRRPRQPSQL